MAMPELIPDDMPPDDPPPRWQGPWRIAGLALGVLMVLGMLAAVGYSLFTAWRDGA
jgi:hypothetical protein